MPNMNLEFLREVIVLCNVYSILALIWGAIAIKQKNPILHKRLMLSGVGASVLLLMAYLIYHFFIGRFRFTGEESIRLIFFAILITHTILATIVPFAVMGVLWFAHKQMHEKHKRLARPTLLAWLYVSVTGIVIYFMSN